MMINKKIIDAIINQADAKVTKALLKRILHEIVEFRPWYETALNVMLTILSGASTSIDIEENVMSCPKAKLIELFAPSIYLNGKELISVTPIKVSILEGTVRIKYTIKDAKDEEQESEGSFTIPEEFYS